MIRNFDKSKDNTGAAIFGVDKRLRESLQALWLSLPKGKQGLEELETQFKRLSERALRDFREDHEQFDEKPATDAEPGLL